MRYPVLIRLIVTSFCTDVVGVAHPASKLIAIADTVSPMLKRSALIGMIKQSPYYLVV
ncbi:hypothetical protein ACFOEM_00010 [Paenalcaligenes hominis]|uniref:hypothetical protein n=1 Tax=Paenalcaligenes hominis TaxID=643674 RepID=UPI00361FD4A1